MKYNLYCNRYHPVTGEYESNMAVTSEINPNNIPYNLQIRLDVDKYHNGDIASAKINNSLDCDMREYQTTINHLEHIEYYGRIRAATLIVINSQIKTLTILEQRRNAKGGANYNPAEWPLPF